MKRPTDLFAREHEWDDLATFAQRPGSGTHLALVRGRRRQGKSFLLRRLAAQTDGFYYQAVEEERSQALDSFGTALGQYLRVPGGRLALGDWDAAFAALADVPTTSRPRLVVLDEFPYLLAHSPELPSLLQRAIDRSRDGGAPLRLVVCGSALSVMASLLTGTQALRGRATLDVVMRMFDYRASAAFWGIDDPHTAFTVHAILGGTPGYRDLLPARPPKRPSDLSRWVAEGPLNPSSALFREDAYLLTEERTLTDRALYHAVVASIANGKTTQSGIAAALGRDSHAIQHPLRALEEAGFVSRDDDVLRSRRPIYRVADPIVRFHHVVTRRDLARFEDRRTAAAWEDAEPRFRAHVLGPHFEELARVFAFEWAEAATVGGVAADVGAAVINDIAARAQHQLDVVVLGRDTSGSTRVLALGEAKHTHEKRTAADLSRLEHIRRIVAAKHPSAVDAKLLLFSASGFDRTLSAAASNAGVELIDIDRLYRGS